MAWKGIVVYLILLALYRLVYIRSIRWIVTDEGVRIKEGLLPWRKMDYMHPYETIFEAMYSFGFFAKLFRYGTCTIRRTEGITTAIEETHMHNAGKIIGLINSHLKQSRQVAKGGPPVHATRTEVEELAGLAKLKADGDISPDEYETMKRKIIER
jgi:hypothetical protein